MRPTARRLALASLAAAVGLAVLTAAPAPASACDCGGPPNTVASARARLEVVAFGRTIEVKSASHGQATITFRVAQAWQGTTAGADLVFDLDASDCGFQLLPGDEALIYIPRTGEVGGCRGDASARVVTGAAIAKDLAALGPAASAVAVGAAIPPVSAGELIDVDGKVNQTFEFAWRTSLRIRVTKARAGAKVGQIMMVTTPVGACGQSLPTRMDDRVTVRARRVGPSAANDQVLISPCLPGTQLKVAPRRRSR